MGYSTANTHSKIPTSSHMFLMKKEEGKPLLMGYSIVLLISPRKNYLGMLQSPVYWEDDAEVVNVERKVKESLQKSEPLLFLPLLRKLYFFYHPTVFCL